MSKTSFTYVDIGLAGLSSATVPRADRPILLKDTDIYRYITIGILISVSVLVSVRKSLKYHIGIGIGNYKLQHFFGHIFYLAFKLFTTQNFQGP